MQQLIFAEAHSPITQEKTLNVGLKGQLDSPFNLFVNLEQLLDPAAPQIQLFIYSMGKKMVAGWGLYDRERQVFELDGTCRYLLPQLYPMTRWWRSQNYHYAGNAVTNRPRALLTKYITGTPPPTYEDYKRWKHLVAWYEGRITEGELESVYPGITDLLPDDPLDLAEEIEDLKGQIKTEEHQINLQKVHHETMGAISPLIIELLRELLMKFEQYISRANLDPTSMMTCPELDSCRVDRRGPGCQVYYHEPTGDFR